MRQPLVITSVRPPTPGINAFSRLKQWQVYVVGDKKTPKTWHISGVRFLSSKQQRTMAWRTARLLPWNHYSRKMIGYLCAMETGAAVIAETDDDNIPKPGWAFPRFSGVFDVSPPKKNFINIYKYFSDQHLWPRGFPLNRITDPDTVIQAAELRRREMRVGIWQGLADNDPDVDAVYRLTCGAPCTFRKKKPLVLDRNTVSPFNSQNTAFSRAVFPLLYLPAFVTFRFTDILRGLVAQPILWRHDYFLGFTQATVDQQRNEHDLMADFASEIPGYLHAEKIVELIDATLKSGCSISDHLFCAYEALQRSGIVEKKELVLLDAWLADISTCYRPAP